MNCGLIDLPCYLEGWFWGLVNMVPLWAWIALAIVAVGVIWKFAGWPGLIGLAGAVGFILGRRSMTDDFTGEVEGMDATPPFRRKPRVSRTAKRTPDSLARRPNETAAEWQDRINGR